MLIFWGIGKIFSPKIWYPCLSIHLSVRPYISWKPLKNLLPRARGETPIFAFFTGTAHCPIRSTSTQQNTHIIWWLEVRTYFRTLLPSPESRSSLAFKPSITVPLAWRTIHCTGNLWRVVHCISEGRKILILNFKYMYHNSSHLSCTLLYYTIYNSWEDLDRTDFFYQVPSLTTILKENQQISKRGRQEFENTYLYDFNESSAFLLISRSVLFAAKSFKGWKIKCIQIS